MGTPGLASYQAAKAAATIFSMSLAAEVEPLGIKVTVVVSVMRTGTNRAIPAKADDVIVRISRMDEPPRRLPLGADAVRFARAAADRLAAEDARWHEMSTSIGFEV